MDPDPTGSSQLYHLAEEALNNQTGESRAFDTVRFCVMNGLVADLEKLVEVHHLDLKSFFLDSPVTRSVTLPADTTMVSFIIKCGLTKDHFGPATFHALLRQPIVEMPEKLLDLMDLLAPLGFDLEHRIDNDTVLDKVARGISLDGKLYLTQVSAKLDQLFEKLLELGSRFSVESAPHDALRILAHGDNWRYVEPWWDQLSNEARVQYYRISGAYSLLTRPNPSRGPPIYAIHVTEDSMNQAITSWKEAIAENRQSVCLSVHRRSSAELLRDTQIINSVQGLDDLKSRASTWEFTQQALLIVEQYEERLIPKCVKDLLRRVPTTEAFSCNQKLMLISYLSKLCDCTRLHYEILLWACPKWDDSVAISDLIPYAYELVQRYSLNYEYHPFHRVVSDMVTPYLQSTSERHILEQVVCLKSILERSVLFSFLTLCLVVEPIIFDTPKMSFLVKALDTIGATVAYPSKSAACLRLLHNRVQVETDSKYAEIIQIALKSACCSFDLPVSEVIQSPVFGRRVNRLCCQAAKIVARTNYEPIISDMSNMEVCISQNKTAPLGTFIAIHKAQSDGDD